MKSDESVNILNDKAARIRCSIARLTAGRPGFGLTGGVEVEDWPDSPEKSAMLRLRAAFRVWKSDVSNDEKYATLSEAIDYAAELRFL